MSDLTDFLLERIAEDELHALGRCVAPCPQWQTHPGHLCADHVLAECEAKRRMVGAYVDVAVSAVDDYDQGVREGLWGALRHLAAVHSAHPDYRDEWRP